MQFLQKLTDLFSKKNNDPLENFAKQNKNVDLQVKELKSALVEHELLNKQ
jgi:hypothetical protein